MRQKIFVLVILILLQVGIFTHPALAVSCKDTKISWEPKNFPEDATEFKLTVQITDINVLNNLKGNAAQLYIEGTTISGPPVTDNKLEFILPSNLIKRREDPYRGKLQWLPPGTSSYTDYCTDITYQIGTTTCNIGYPTQNMSIPPNSALTIKFSGIANTPYILNTNTHRFLGIGPGTRVATVTNSSGQGEVSLTTIPGDNGDTVRLTLFPDLTKVPNVQDTSKYQCITDIKIDAKAAPPSTPPPGPVGLIPATETVRTCPKEGEELDPARHFDKGQCTKGGGKVVEGCTDDLNNPGIATAIGCIHTNPAEFVKDFLTFAIGISGGLAFLMMLLGVFGMLTSAGNPDSLNAGRERLTNAIIGLLFVIFSVLLMQIIGFDILKIPGFGR